MRDWEFHRVVRPQSLSMVHNKSFTGRGVQLLGLINPLDVCMGNGPSPAFLLCIETCNRFVKWFFG